MLNEKKKKTKLRRFNVREWYYSKKIIIKNNGNFFFYYTYWLQNRQFVYIKIYKDNKFIFKIIYIYIYICK